jgi:hypothetical protein
MSSRYTPASTRKPYRLDEISSTRILSTAKNKRKPGPGVAVDTPPRKQFATAGRSFPLLPPPTPLAASSMPIISREELAIELTKGVSFTAGYCLDISSRAIRLLRRPLSVIFFLYLLVLIIEHVTNTLQPAFAPLCMLPGIAGLMWCRSFEHHASGGRTTRWADYPKLVEAQSATFEQLLDQSVSGSRLSLEIKKAEMATSDLITLVRVSDLKSRDMLAALLAEFVDDAKTTGRGLQKLSSKIWGAVDS